MVTIAVFFDFTKAFDYVNHTILIDKLRTLGFSCSALRWLCSYLHARSQVVRDPVTRLTSSERLIASGVPQGSVLGPLLFALYLSDFGSALSHCKYNFYADDLLIYLHSETRSLTDAILKVDEDINGILKWASTNTLALNPGKTKAMIMGTSKFISGLRWDTLPEIHINDSVIPFCDTVQYFGVHLSLSWEKHVTKTSAVFMLLCISSRFAGICYHRLSDYSLSLH